MPYKIKKLIHLWLKCLPLFCLLLASSPTIAQYKISEQSLKQADMVSGEQVWQQYCAFCHSLGKGEADITGPNLYQLFKRPVGSKPGFNYSDALKHDKRDWTADLFADYVKDPAATIPGNRMPPVNIPADKVLALTSYVMRTSASVDWDQAKKPLLAGGLDAELASSKPKFWAQYMDNTIRYSVDWEQGNYTFVAYFNEDGTISGNNRGLKGFWRMRDKRTFCYGIQGIAVPPYEWIECFKPKADKNFSFGKILRSTEMVRNGKPVAVSFLQGRPHPLEGDAHPDYWTFLFNNITRYKIKVNGKTEIVDARFNQDSTISSPQGVSGKWAAQGAAGKDQKMCYHLSGVPGIEGELSECFALVLMFNPRVGARWPAVFDQGNTYWAEIVAGE